MIEQSIYEHLQSAPELNILTQYGGKTAVFNQNAPADADPMWAAKPQYPRIVFAADWEHSADRALGGTLSVDVFCQEQGIPPENMEPIVRNLLHGWFFSSGVETVAAQWVNSNYFTEPKNKIAGVTLTFALLGFPKMTISPDVVARINVWTAEQFPPLSVINQTELPPAWKPETGAAVYWRISATAPAGWIPDTYQTIWRTASLRGHVFAPDISSVTQTAQEIVCGLYAAKRLRKEHEAPVMVNTNNSIDPTADALRTGQIMVDATFGVIVHRVADQPLKHIYTDKIEV